MHLKYFTAQVYIIFKIVSNERFKSTTNLAFQFNEKFLEISFTKFQIKRKKFKIQ